MEFVKRNYNDFLIYCDIPYSNTDCGKYKGFDSDRFYEWSKDQENIYISEYKMPEDDFVEIANIEKTVLSAMNSNSIKSTEKIFTNKKTYEKFDKDKKKMIEMNLSKQMTLFDFI